MQIGLNHLSSNTAYDTAHTVIPTDTVHTEPISKGVTMLPAIPPLGNDKIVHISGKVVKILSTAHFTKMRHL